MGGSKTKDERFVMCAYEAALKSGDLDTVLDRYEIGRRAGLSPKGVNAICNLLAQANFIKKLSDSEFRLTSNGEALAKRLLGE
jgi:hypothetical protein